MDQVLTTAELSANKDVLLLGHGLEEGDDGALAIGPGGLGTERARLHALKAEGKAAVDHAALDGLADHVQRRRAGAAVVVDVHDGDLGQAHLVHGALAAGAVACCVCVFFGELYAATKSWLGRTKAVADRSLLNLVKVDA